MAKEDDVTDGATTEENAATAAARRRGIDGDAPLSADEIGKAVARALDRQRNAPKEPEAPLPVTVRASVRCGYVTAFINDARGKRHETRPGTITFRKDETADGKEYTVPHGRPIVLKRDAFLRYRRDGKVVIAQ